MRLKYLRRHGRNLLLHSLFFAPLPVMTQSTCDGLTDNEIEQSVANCRTASEIIVSPGSAITRVDLGGIEEVSGVLGIRGRAVQELVGSSLNQVGGDFIVQSENLSSLALPEFSLGGDLRFMLEESPIKTVNLNFSSLSFDTSLTFESSPGIQRLIISLNPPSTGQRTLRLDQVYGLNTLEVSGTTFSSVTILATILRTLPDIFQSEMESILFGSMGELEDLSIPILQNTSSKITLLGVGSSKVEFPNLSTMGDNFELSQSETKTLSLPELTTTGDGGFFLSLNSKLQTVSVPKLNTAAEVVLTNNSALSEVSFDSLETVGIISVIGNQQMTTIDLEAWFPVLTQVTEYITIIGQITNITFPSRKNNIGVAAPSILIESTLEIDCDAIRRDADAKQAVAASSGIDCKSGPKGAEPTFTGTPQSTGTSRSGNNLGNNDTNGGDAGGGSKTNIGAIVGGVVGGVVVLVLAVAAIWWFKFRRPAPPMYAPDGGEAKVGGIEEDIGGIQDTNPGAGGITGKYNNDGSGFNNKFFR